MIWRDLVRLSSALSQRVGGGPPEAPLWDHLDACGIEFRSAAGALVDQYGTTQAIWADDLDLCTLRGNAQFIQGLDHPPQFEISPQTDLHVPPAELRCYVRASHDHRLNYAKAIRGLTRRFGKGQEASDKRSVGRVWSFGQASLRCTVFPPDRPGANGTDRRNEMFPETLSEAAIIIRPGWPISG